MDLEMQRHRQERNRGRSILHLEMQSQGQERNRGRSVSPYEEALLAQTARNDEEAEEAELLDEAEAVDSCARPSTSCSDEQAQSRR